MNFSKTLFFTTVVSVFLFSQISAKTLPESAMKIISLGIVADPMLMVNGWITKEIAQQTLTAIDKLKSNAKTNNNPAVKLFATSQEETTFIQKSRNLLSNRLGTAFGSIRDHKKIVIPLLEKSIGTSSKSGTYESTPSLLAKYFNSDPSISTESFFEKEVTTLDALIVMCTEFVTFFNDLEENLSSGAKESYEKGVETLIMKAKKSVSR